MPGQRESSGCGFTSSSSSSCLTRLNFDEQANSYLGKLSPSALGKYQKHYRLRGKSDTAETLLKSVVRHFEAQNVEEAEVVQNFLLALQKVAGH